MIYALIDKEGLNKRNISLKEIVQKVEGLKVPLVQYRNKEGSLEEKKEDLLLIRQFYSGQLIVNDTIELIAYADGLHVGQEDIRKYHSSDLSKAIKQIRERISNKLLGLSTHNQEEILEANSLDLNYIGLGAYRGTATKVEAKVLGDDVVKLAKLSKHPVGVIGGVKLSDSFDSAITYRVIGSDLYEN